MIKVCSSRSHSTFKFHKYAFLCSLIGPLAGAGSDLSSCCSKAHGRPKVHALIARLAKERIMVTYFHMLFLSIICDVGTFFRREKVIIYYCRTVSRQKIQESHTFKFWTGLSRVNSILVRRLSDIQRRPVSIVSTFDKTMAQSCGVELATELYPT